jgi:hypothetical protein
MAKRRKQQVQMPEVDPQWQQYEEDRKRGIDTWSARPRPASDGYFADDLDHRPADVTDHKD